MSDCITTRLGKLREMRESLCKKEKTWKEAFAMRDWIVDQKVVRPTNKLVSHTGFLISAKFVKY